MDKYTAYNNRLVISDENGPKYGFKIKGGNYGDINQVIRSETNRGSKKILNTFELTEAQYEGEYNNELTYIE